MLSSEGKPIDTAASGQQALSNTPINLELERDTPQESLRDRQQTFQLIDSLLSFEACLYHQILPLQLEDNILLLGMVHPQDSSALDYVHRILSYINCTMATQEIATDSHRRLLSAYLSYKNTPHTDTNNVNLASLNFAPESSASHIAELEQPVTTVAPAETPQNPQPANELSSFFNSESLIPTHDKQQEIAETAIASNLTILPVPDPELRTPVEILRKLPPKKLLEELLGRVLKGGIGRLYLERQPYQGRILWSDNGVVQSVLDL
jgi:Type II secretion system (T2SS), protein E, N-terminal domain